MIAAEEAVKWRVRGLARSQRRRCSRRVGRYATPPHACHGSVRRGPCGAEVQDEVLAWGDIKGKVSGVGDAECNGEDENGSEEIGIVINAVGEVVSTWTRLGSEWRAVETVNCCRKVTLTSS